MKKSRILILIVFTVSVVSIVFPLFSPDTSFLKNEAILGLIITVLVTLTIVSFLLEFESIARGSKEIALVSTLGTVSAVSRIPFAAIPSMQPCTYLIICSGYIFGPVAGFTVGALTALISNIILGQGPWTPYQMFAWGLAGFSSAYIRKFNLKRTGLMAFGFIWGYIFGLIMNIWFWGFFIYPHTFITFLAVEAYSIWFDTLHAIGNATFLGLLGIRTIKILERFKKRFQVVLE